MEVGTAHNANDAQDWRWVLQCVERYAHHPDYVRDVATAIGLEPREAIPFQPRMESGLPVRGTLPIDTALA